MNIDIPEVSAMLQTARFYRDGEAPFVEVGFVGSKDTVVSKVKPEHMAKFQSQWNSFCDGTPMKQRAGTPLTEIMPEQQALQYIAKNVHTAEEIAVLSDAQCQALGHGTITLRKAAQEMLTLRALKQQETTRDILTKASASIGAVPAEKYASESDLKEISAKVDSLTESIGALVAALAPKKRGPKPKNQAEE